MPVTSPPAAIPISSAPFTPTPKAGKFCAVPSISLALSSATACYGVNGLNDTTYVGNAVVFETNASRNIASINNTAGLICLTESYTRYGAAIMRPAFYNSPAGAFYYWHYWDSVQNLDQVSSNHFDGGNFLFADGHAKWRKLSTLHAGEFGLTPDDTYQPTTTQTHATYFVSTTL